MANHIEFRKVITTQLYAGGESQSETWEYRTKDIITDGVTVRLSDWSAWTSIEAVTIKHVQSEG